MSPRWSRPGVDRGGRGLRVRLARAVLLAGLSIAPMRVPAWRLDPSPPPAAVLPVGEPVPLLAGWAR